jgi:acetoin utilization deacetylase AcuC-like enzyme
LFWSARDSSFDDFTPKLSIFFTFVQGFGVMTRALMGASENCRVVLALEGGYHPRGVADCVAEVIAARSCCRSHILYGKQRHNPFPLFISAVAH